MGQQEGVVKFNLEFTPAAPEPVEDFETLNRWRQTLYAQQLIGQDPNRYGGYGFGNISQRIAPWDAPPRQRAFVISGTQTGGLATLSPEHYALVLEWQPDRNLVIAQGPIRPSSESLTHGAIYDLDNRIRVIMHGHSPLLWENATALGIPATDAAIPYGSPEMAAEVVRLYREGLLAERSLFSMGGHEDGIIAFGHTADETGKVLLDCLAQAREITA